MQFVPVGWRQKPHSTLTLKVLNFFSSGNSLASEGTKPLSEPMLTYDFIPVAVNGGQSYKDSRHQPQ